MDITKQKESLTKWNRKIHIYLGLYFIFFTWLFGFSGLLLNHHWEFANFWENREEIKYHKTIVIFVGRIGLHVSILCTQQTDSLSKPGV